MLKAELPAPWQWLCYFEPEPGQECEWVLLAPWGADKGQGIWMVIEDGNSLPRFYVPGATIKGFKDGTGLMISDPTFTAWMPALNQLKESN